MIAAISSGKTGTSKTLQLRRIVNRANVTPMSH